jgi:Transposase IS116/IS110/IS902 family
LEQIGSLTERIREYDRKLEAISREHYPETELLRQVEGIGPLTALTFVLTLEDPYRFERSRSVGAYLALVPATDRSGDSDPVCVPSSDASMFVKVPKSRDFLLKTVKLGSGRSLGRCIS